LIAADNQAAIQALCNNQLQPGQHILTTILNTIWALQTKRRSVRIHIVWVVGHKGVAGNELTDKYAKEATEGQCSPTEILLPLLWKRLPASIAAIKAQRKFKLVEKWKKLWAVSPCYSHLKKIDASLPSWQTYQMLT
jgi:hypothetical protein